ncbi:synaptic vesicle glycoprotein 2A-like isoform X2 [Periplaneta americana]|uniref:synaptic vesicle glycoprotein 2A-like isoform X2 n=1 Tax=Periplaneta americana TaxID=6978 RepID=UPI0037E6F7B3
MATRQEEDATKNDEKSTSIVETADFETAIANTGNVSTAFLWGYLADNYGRRLLLLSGCFLLTVITVASSFSQVFWLLVVFKFFGGVISCGPFVLMLTYMAEFTSTLHRTRIMMMNAIYNSLGFITVPALAWAIIRQPWSWTLFGGYIVFNSWRVFIVACAVPSFIAGCFLLFFDESPKFLMSQGRREEALNVFKRIYSLNTGKHPDTFPVKSLVDEKKQNGDILTPNGDVPNRNHSTDMKQFLRKPYIGRILLVISIQYGGLWGMSTIRLWLPQILAILEEYTSLYKSQTENVFLCDMMASRTGAQAVVNATMNVTTSEECVPVQFGDTTFIYNIIVGVVAAVWNLSANMIVGYFCKKNVLKFGYVLCACCMASMYWSINMEIVLALSSIFIGCNQMVIIALLSTVVELFPTNMRTTAMSLTMMLGRVSALTGNLTFPVFLEINCAMPFFFIAAISLLCALLAFFIPDTTGKALE